MAFVALAVGSVAVLVPSTAGAETIAVPAVAQQYVGGSEVTVPCPSASCSSSVGETTGDPSNSPLVTMTTPNVVSAGAVSVILPKHKRGQVAPNGLPCASGALLRTTGGFKLSEVLQACRTQQTTFRFKYRLPAGYRLVLTSAPGGSIPMGAITGDSSSMPVPAGEPTVIAVTSAHSPALVTQANTYAFLDYPTAYDALGDAIPTSYQVLGRDILVQTVDWVRVLQLAASEGSGVFPVTVDPELTFGIWAYVYFSYGDISSAFFVAWVAGAPAAAAYICGVTFVDPPVGLTCTFLVAAAWALVADQFHTAQDRGGGIVWKIAYWGQPIGYLYVGSWS